MIIEEKKIQLFTDGGSRNNPGPAAIGGVLYDGDTIIFEFSKFIGTATNNQAEYNALLYGLKMCKKLKYDLVDCFLDSELVVMQMKGLYKVKNADLQILNKEVKKICEDFSKVSFTAIRREQNKLADKLVNKALDGE